MASAREPEPTPDKEQAVAPVEPADWVKPVELIELLHRRTRKRNPPDNPRAKRVCVNSGILSVGLDKLI